MSGPPPGPATGTAPASPESVLWYEVEPNYGGWTLGDYLREKMKRPPEPDRMARMLAGRSLVYEGPAPLQAGTRIWPGLRFGLLRRFLGDELPAPPVAEVFCDGALLVVEKPAGLAVHPTARYFRSTLTFVLEERYRTVEGKPDPAHRLDRDTSGLTACGRTSRDTRALKAAFAARRVEKAYLALCEGEAPAGPFEIDRPLAVGTERVRVKMRVDPAGAQAQTTCEVVARYRDGDGRPLSLVRCVPHTGRQHQLRAHLASLGLPIVGDKLYGPDEGIFLRLADSGAVPAPPGAFDPAITEEERRLLRLPRQALHASELALPHPRTGERMAFVSPLPLDLAGLVASLRRE
jgi:23S rRNA pseudouridine1911/1915/1917 synthase